MITPKHSAAYCREQKKDIIQSNLVNVSQLDATSDRQVEISEISLKGKNI